MGTAAALDGARDGAHRAVDGRAQPTDIQLSGTSIPENSGVGAPIGTLSTSDPDAGDTFTYALVSGQGSGGNPSFEIVGDQLRSASDFDYETKRSYFIRVRSTDAGGEFIEERFTISVTDVNDAPVAGNDTFGGARSAIGNTTLVVDDPSDGAPVAADPHKSVNGAILANDTDVDGPGPLRVIAGTFATSDGGSVRVQPDGDFTFQPAAGTSCADGSDSFDYTIRDGGSPNLSDVGTVTIAIADCVWYVSNSAAGNAGTSIAPFDTLAQAEVASGAGNTIFVFDGDNTTTGYGAGIDLKNDQRLIGESAGLTVGDITLQPANPANRPTITDNNADVVVLASGNTVRGFEIDPQGTGGGISGGDGDASGTINRVHVNDTGTAGTQAGLELSGTSGTWNISELEVDTAAGATGVLLSSAGTTRFRADGTISIRSNGGRALAALSTDMGPDSVFDDLTSTNSNAGGVTLANTFGTTELGDGTGIDLNLTTTAGPSPALEILSAGNVTVNAVGTDNVRATGGPAVDVQGTPGANLNLDDVDSTDSVADGINLDGLGIGTFAASSGTIAGAAGVSFDLNGGFASVSYPGNIADGSGATAIDITGRSGGSVNLSGQIADSEDAGGTINVSSNTGGSTTLSNPSVRVNAGAAPGLTFNNSDGHALALSGGGLRIDTTTGAGLEALTSGRLAVTGDGNTVDTTTGRALNLSDTEIGNADLTFRRLSSDGAVNGIRLNNTANAIGGLFVTGTGAPNSGGTIQNSTGAGVSLTGVPGGVSLVTVAVTGGGDDGIAGSNVNGLTLDDTTITNNGNANGEDGVGLTQLTGTSPFTNSNVSDNFDSNVTVRNSSGTLNLNITGGTYSGAAGGQGDGIFVEGSGTGKQNLNVQGPIALADNVGDAVQHNGTPTSTADSDVIVNNATISSPAGGGSVLGGGITVTEGGPPVGGGSNTDVEITGNDIQNAVIGAIAVGTTGTVVDQQIANVDARIINNVIGTTGAAGSGSVQGNGIFVDSNGNSNVRALITQNQIRQWTNRSAIALDALDGDAEMNATVRRNVMTEPNSAFAGTTTRGMTLQLGTAQAGDSVDVCLDIGHASDAAVKNQVFGTGESPQPDIRYLHEGPSSAVALAGYAGPSSPTITDIANYLAPRNDLGGTPTVTGTPAGAGSTTTGVASCLQPTGP